LNMQRKVKIEYKQWFSKMKVNINKPKYSLILNYEFSVS